MSYYLECLKPGESSWIRMPSKYKEPYSGDILEWVSEVTGLQFRQAQLQLDWDKAKAHLDEVRSQYEELPAANGMLALVVTFDPLRARLMSGERTEELHEAMMAVE